jgi:uncharacterized protein YecT (DUF1311 family)
MDGVGLHDMTSARTKFRVFSLGVSWLLWNGYSHADWVVHGAAAKCAGSKGFAIVGIEWTSDDNPALDPVPRDYDRLEGMAALSCNVGDTKVKATVRVLPPAGRGMGMGTGRASIDELRVDGLPIFGYPTAFNWQIPGSNAIVKLTVFREGNVPFVEICDVEKCDQESLAADELLNQTYRQVMAASSARDRERLRQEQRLWLKERDPQCQLAVAGTENQPLAFLRCILSATAIRTMRIQESQPDEK